MSSRTSSVSQLKAQGVIVQPRRAVFYGWWVVAASAVGLFWGPSVTVYSFSVFLKPLMQEFHAGRAAVSLGITLHHMAGAVCAPIVGWLVDRYGSRRVILSATAMFACILLSNKLFSANIWHLYVFYLAIGVIINGVGPIPYGNLVAHWFDRHRGLALGLTMIRATAHYNVRMAHGLRSSWLRGSSHCFSGSGRGSSGEAAGPGAFARRRGAEKFEGRKQSYSAWSRRARCLAQPNVLADGVRFLLCEP